MKTKETLILASLAACAGFGTFPKSLNKTGAAPKTISEEIVHGVNGCLYDDLEMDKVNEQFAVLAKDGLDITEGCWQLARVDGFCAEKAGRNMCCISCGEALNPTIEDQMQGRFWSSLSPATQTTLVVGAVVGAPVALIVLPALVAGYYSYKFLATTGADGR